MKSLPQSVTLKAFFEVFLMLFTTSCMKNIPAVTTEPIVNIERTSAKSGGTVTDDGNAEVSERGVCWSINHSPTIADSKTVDGSGIGSFTSNITQLTPGVAYYVKAYATNSEGTGYGIELNFTTSIKPPSAAALAATLVTNTTATLNGAVNANGNSTTVTFEYGISNLYGSTAPGKPSPVTGLSPTSVSAVIVGLTPNTAYHFRIKSVNTDGTAYSDDLTFTTRQAKTEAATNITNIGATLNGTVNANNLSTFVTFEYGINSSYGSTKESIPNTITGGNSISVSAIITGLISGQIYHFRVVTKNSDGTAYGDDVTFTTSVKDFDGNVYSIVTIGTQVWMKENLKTTKFNDGSSIPYTSLRNWGNSASGCYCWYHDSIEYKSIYGALFNWEAVSTGKLCPTGGWRVPTDADWTNLTTFLGGESVAGGKMKETGTIHWKNPNTGATNESSFTAMPGGIRIWGILTSSFDREIKEAGYWWSATEPIDGKVKLCRLSFGNIQVSKSEGLAVVYGASVRCVRNY